ncbi:MAG: hypothetical protein HY939_01950 [Gammaproteobacteria bacterium]|nr:hypothetical protein [Gammaproteobacteria bacterium]
MSKFDNVKFTRNNAPDWHDYFFFIPNDAAKNRLVAFLQDGVKQQQQAASVMAPTPAPMAIAIAPVLAAPAPTTPPPAVQPQQVYMAQATAPMIGAPAAPMPTVVAVAPQQPRPVLTVFPGSTQISSDNDFSVFLNRYFSRGDEQSRLTVGKAINPGFPQQTDGFIYITVPRVNNMEEKIHDLLKQHTEFDRTGNNGTMRQDLPAQTDGSSWTCFWVLPTQASLLKQAIERELRQTTTALATTVAAPMPPLSMLRRGAAAPSTTASRSVIFPPAATSNSKDSGEAEADRQVALAAANAETARLRSLGKEATVAAEAQRAQLAAAELKNREAQAQLALTEAALAAASSSSPRR